jgi:hypothetical protein
VHAPKREKVHIADKWDTEIRKSGDASLILNGYAPSIIHAPRLLFTALVVLFASLLSPSSPLQASGVLSNLPVEFLKSDLAMMGRSEREKGGDVVPLGGFQYLRLRLHAASASRHAKSLRQLLVATFVHLHHVRGELCRPSTFLISFPFTS